MRKLLPLLSILILGGSFWACDENIEFGEDSPVYVVASWEGKDSVLGGRHYNFKMNIIATKGELDKLSVTSMDGFNGKKLLETVQLSGTQKAYEYDFEPPIFPEPMVEMELRVNVTNTLGNEWNGTKKYKVYTTDYTLTETDVTLVEIPAPGKSNGFRFINGKPAPINTEVIQDRTLQEVVIYRNTNNNNASKGILTYTGNVRFSRLDFDYANATYNSVVNQYQEQYSKYKTKLQESPSEAQEVLSHEIGNLTAGDVILIGTLDESNEKAYALGVMKVLQVPETNDQAGDIYHFAVKGMGR